MKTQGQYVHNYQYNKKTMQAWMFDKQGMNLVYKYLFTKMASCSSQIVSNIRSMLQYLLNCFPKNYKIPFMTRKSTNIEVHFDPNGSLIFKSFLFCYFWQWPFILEGIAVNFIVKQKGLRIMTFPQHLQIYAAWKDPQGRGTC